MLMASCNQGQHSDIRCTKESNHRGTKRESEILGSFSRSVSSVVKGLIAKLESDRPLEYHESAIVLNFALLGESLHRSEHIADWVLSREIFLHAANAKFCAFGIF